MSILSQAIGAKGVKGASAIGGTNVSATCHEGAEGAEGGSATGLSVIA